MPDNTPSLENSRLIELTQISRVYGTGRAAWPALRAIDLRIDRGEFVAVMGPSGSGKSTCLNILGCLDRPSAGSYLYNHIAVEQLSRDQRARLRRHFFGFIFQGFNLLHRTKALENVELPLIYRGIAAKKRRQLARAALATVGLDGWEGHTPAELSGGQQQRVAIARAIVTNPQLLLADEPTGNLDSECSREVMKLLTNLNKEMGITIVMVTHDPDMASFANRRIHFRDGRIESGATPGEAAV
jgi:putative ABC transport system ATP-binding protein